MKKINSVFLIVMGFFVQYGNGQIVSSGDGKLGGSSNKFSSGMVKAYEPGCLALDAWKARVSPETAWDAVDPELNESKTSQLDSTTMQMAEAAAREMGEQGKTSLQDTVSKSIVASPSQDHDIMNAISASKHDRANSSISYHAPAW